MPNNAKWGGNVVLFPVQRVFGSILTLGNNGGIEEKLGRYVSKVYTVFTTTKIIQNINKD